MMVTWQVSNPGYRPIIYDNHHNSGKRDKADIEALVAQKATLQLGHPLPPWASGEGSIAIHFRQSITTCYTYAHAQYIIRRARHMLQL